MTDAEAPVLGWLLAMSWMIFFSTVFIFGITVFVVRLESFSAVGEGAEFPATGALALVMFSIPMAIAVSFLSDQSRLYGPRMIKEIS